MNREETGTAVALPAGSPKPEELQKEVAPVVELANSITIDSHMMYEEAADELREIVTRKKALEERRLGITRPMDAAKAAVMELFRAPIQALDQADKIFRGKMLTWDNEQRRIRQEEERKAREAAERERKRLEEEAREAEETGDVATAVAIQSAAEAITHHQPVVAAPAAPRGISTSTRWNAEVEDKITFIKHCLTPEGEQYLEALTIDMKPLNKMATALKDKMKIPGIKAVSNVGMAVRGR